MDSFVASKSWHHADILKTDTEGCEFEVLLGAKRLISKQQIGLIMVAYEDQSTRDRSMSLLGHLRQRFDQDIEFAITWWILTSMSC